MNTITEPQQAPQETIVVNTSGQGKSAVVPPEIKGWSWGAFFLNWIWGIFNNVFIALLCLIPFVNFIMVFVLGAKGREWAWRNKKWQSVEHFNNVQHKWSVAGAIIFFLPFIFIFLGFIIPLFSS